MAKNNKSEEKTFGAPSDQLAEVAMAEATNASVPHPDAANYVLQPTSAEIPASMGEVPDGRFMEEVRKGTDEVKSDSVEAHPAENQPRYGVEA